MGTSRSASFIVIAGIAILGLGLLTKRRILPNGSALRPIVPKDDPARMRETAHPPSSPPQQPAMQHDGSIEAYISSRAGRIGDRTVVIVTYASYSYLDHLLNWLIFLHRLEIKNYAVLCLDEQLQVFLKRRGFSCYVDEQSIMSSAKETIQALWMRRMAHLIRFLSLNVDVVFSDVDAVWLQNPFTRRIPGAKYALFDVDAFDVSAGRGQFPVDVRDAWGATLIMGAIYFKSTHRVHTLLSAAMEAMKLMHDDQVGLNRALVQMLGADPIPIFGKKLSQVSPNGEFAISRGGGLTVAFAPHNFLPRRCKDVVKAEWKRSVIIAHCHYNEGVPNRKATWKSGDRAAMRITLLKKYKIWLLADEWREKSQQGSTTFDAWISAISA